MLEIGRPLEGQEVRLTESADTLEKALLYIYPRAVPEFELKFPECLVVMKALHKYEVRYNSYHQFRCSERNCGGS